MRMSKSFLVEYTGPRDVGDREALYKGEKYYPIMRDYGDYTVYDEKYTSTVCKGRCEPAPGSEAFAGCLARNQRKEAAAAARRRESDDGGGEEDDEDDGLVFHSARSAMEEEVPVVSDVDAYGILDGG